MFENNTLEFKVESFRKLPNPYQQKEPRKEDEEDYPQMYYAICDVKNLPANIPMSTNPRLQSMKTGVAKKIQRALVNTTEPYFYLLNRGMLLSAGNVHYDNNSGNIRITFDDLDVHGNVDGGHTYKAILEKREELEYGEQYVKLEVLTGIEDIFQSLAEARNTSTQVKEQSIAELKHMFELIKDAIKNEPYSNNINFKENDDNDIDISDIISILTMFNIEKYPGMDLYPIIAYSGKKKCIDYYIDEYKKNGETAQNPFIKMKGIMVDIFKLYNMLEINMGSYYKSGNSNGRYGSFKCVGTAREGSKFKSKFYKTDMEYQSPTGFLYPILGAFRALVKEEGGKYVWKTNPFKIMEKMGPDLVSITIGTNPQSIGKDTLRWRALYQTLAIEIMNA